MEFGPNIPESHVERPLSPEEVEIFKQEILWPSINYLRHDFISTSQPNDGFSIVKHVAGDRVTRIALRAQCYVPAQTFLEGIENTWLKRNIGISVEQMQPELTAPMRSSLFKTVTGSEIREYYAEQEKQKGGDDLAAWETKEYFFDMPGREPFYIHSYYSLQSDGGVPVWRDSQLQSGSSREPDSYDMDELRDLNSLFSAQPTSHDFYIVRVALSELGVPLRLLQLKQAA
jgi:hypothetical protein